MTLTLPREKLQQCQNCNLKKQLDHQKIAFERLNLFILLRS